jgi:hypothetical protein
MHWPKMQGFLECVQVAWDRQVPSNHNAFSKFHINLSRVAKAIKTWSRSLISHQKLALAICKEVIEKLEQAQEDRHLTGGNES